MSTILKTIGSLFFASLLFISTLQAVDELYLRGIIKSYDKQKGIIWVNVLSEGCRGLREFRLPENAKEDLDPSLIGQKIDFYINSSVCEKGKIYNMILKGGR
jgi:hypothetical protein